MATVQELKTTLKYILGSWNNDHLEFILLRSKQNCAGLQQSQNRQNKKAQLVKFANPTLWKGTLDLCKHDTWDLTPRD
jgi:hypothetical protein